MSTLKQAYQQDTLPEYMALEVQADYKSEHYDYTLRYDSKGSNSEPLESLESQIVFMAFTIAGEIC